MHLQALFTPKHQKRTSLILKRAGQTRLQPIKGPLVHDENGAYGVETRAHFWLAKPIPAGWLVVHVQSDPEPVTDREPRGYGPIDVEMLTGPYLPHVWGAGQHGKPKTATWIWWVIGAVVALSIIAVLAIVFWKKYLGA
jgi:hypothetical protein